MDSLDFSVDDIKTKIDLTIEEVKPLAKTTKPERKPIRKPAPKVENTKTEAPVQKTEKPQARENREPREKREEPKKKRHLMRLWLCDPEGRPTPPGFRENISGIEVDGTIHTAPLDMVEGAGAD